MDISMAQRVSTSDREWDKLWLGTSEESSRNRAWCHAIFDYVIENAGCTVQQLMEETRGRYLDVDHVDFDSDDAVWVSIAGLLIAREYIFLNHFTGLVWPTAGVLYTPEGSLG